MMNLKTQLEQSFSNNTTSGEEIVALTADPRSLHCHVAERNALAVGFYELRIATPELADVSVPRLQQLSEAISARLTYLLEPIAPIEADADRCTVQMRSNPPLKDDDGRSYYELMARRGGELHLVRYRKEPGGPRERTIATVTTEVLTRLVGDLEAALDDFGAE